MRDVYVPANQDEPVVIHKVTIKDEWIVPGGASSEVGDD